MTTSRRVECVVANCCGVTLSIVAHGIQCPVNEFRLATVRVLTIQSMSISLAGLFHLHIVTSMHPCIDCSRSWIPIVCALESDDVVDDSSSLL